MKNTNLYEDKKLPKFTVVLSPKIVKDMDEIFTINQDKKEELFQWYKYLDEIQDYISNRSIAWNYTGRNIRLPNGTLFIKDFDYNVGYTIKTNNITKQIFVYVFMINLKIDDFGLRKPKVNENIQYTKLKKTIMRQNQKKALYESIMKDVAKVVKRTLNEYETKGGFTTYTLQDLYRMVEEDNYFWAVEFDYNESKDWLPKNFNRLSSRQRAEALVNNAPGWSHQDFFDNYFGPDGEYDEEEDTYTVQGQEGYLTKYVK